ncbi:hypothetical protein [Mesorhizobium sp. WSM3882]|uniref:hypothetical protein n=1 Tax=Mesorhizobium sp. WSM3882 TaxID=2029407 RepID=UPI00117E4C7A|nr:hypothetical protein [Mesorhizobium sp. WSM3882]
MTGHLDGKFIRSTFRDAYVSFGAIDIVAANGCLQGTNAEDLLTYDHFVYFGIFPTLTFSALWCGAVVTAVRERRWSDGLGAQMRLGLGESRLSEPCAH